MPVISEQELRKHLAGGELASLYLLTGEEKLLVKRAARRLADKAGGDAFPEFNRNELPGEAQVDRIADAVNALPFMAERKCVAVYDFDPEERSSEELGKLHELLDDLPETTTLVMAYPTVVSGKSAKWKKLLEKAEKVGCVVRFAQREQGELRRTLMAAAERQGCGLPRYAADRLMDYAGRDLNLLLGEIDKLCAYTLGQGKREITPQLVEEMTPKSTETTVFVMVDALVAGNYNKAYALLDTLFYQNDDPVAIAAAMALPYIDMYRVKSALESGLTTAAPQEYAPEYKPGRDKKLNFRLRKAQQSLRYLPAQALRESLRLLLEADLALKGSRLEKRLVLERLMAQLLLAAQRGKA